ncbi:MAG: PEP-CTERM sorting domain-containing protein [Planctomycetota bacterium]
MFRPPHTVPFVLAGLCLAVGPVSAQTIDLASTMNAGNGSGTPDTGFLSEDLVTGSFGQIARSPDGLYNVADPSQQFGTVGLFPNQANFGIGSLTYDDSGVDSLGIDIAPITGLDTSDFWQAGSSITDINDASGFDFWFQGSNSIVAFGAPTGTVTFSNGDLVSIDLSTSISFTIDYSVFAPTTTYTGTFLISGNQLAIAVNESVELAPGQVSTFVADLTGTVNAVIPEPSSVALLFGGLTLLSLRRAYS